MSLTNLVPSNNNFLTHCLSHTKQVVIACSIVGLASVVATAALGTILKATAVCVAVINPISITVGIAIGAVVLVGIVAYKYFKSCGRLSHSILFTTSSSENRKELPKIELVNNLYRITWNSKRMNGDSITSQSKSVNHRHLYDALREFFREEFWFFDFYITQLSDQSFLIIISSKSEYQKLLNHQNFKCFKTEDVSEIFIEGSEIPAGTSGGHVPNVEINPAGDAQNTQSSVLVGDDQSINKNSTNDVDSINLQPATFIPARNAIEGWTDYRIKFYFTSTVNHILNFRFNEFNGLF